MARQTTERPAERSRRWLVAAGAGLVVLAIAIWAVEREPAGPGAAASAPARESAAREPARGSAVTGALAIETPMPQPQPAVGAPGTIPDSAPGAPPRRSGSRSGSDSGSASHQGSAADAGSDAAPPSPAALAGLYVSVGRQLEALSARKGETATIDLWPRYRWIRIDDAMGAPPARRQEVARMLHDLERDVAAR